MDLSRQIPIEDVQKFADSNKLSFIETSAKNGTNVNKLFDTITSNLYGSQSILTHKDRTVSIYYYENKISTRSAEC